MNKIFFILEWPIDSRVVRFKKGCGGVHGGCKIRFRGKEGRGIIIPEEYIMYNALLIGEGI